MIRKGLRVLAAIVLFVMAGFFCAALTAKAMGSYVRRSSNRERRYRFRHDLPRGAPIAEGDLLVDWLPRDTPPTVPLSRTECLVTRRVVADVAHGDLVQPMVVEGASDCLSRERPEDWSRD